jgi:hypothetical protein
MARSHRNQKDAPSVVVPIDPPSGAVPIAGGVRVSARGAAALEQGLAGVGGGVLVGVVKIAQ